MQSAPPPTAAAPATGSYPPSAQRRLALRMIAALSPNKFSVAEAEEDLSPRRAAEAQCCTVMALPHQPAAEADQKHELTFGQREAGYVLIKPREGGPGWRRGAPPSNDILPVDLHRWQQRTPAHLWACHSCDNPRCIRRAHIRNDEPRTNVEDSHKSGKRGTAVALPERRQRPRRGAAGRSTLSEGVALSSRQAAYCRIDTGSAYFSPTRHLRALARAQGAVETPPLLSFGSAQFQPCARPCVPLY